MGLVNRSTLSRWRNRKSIPRTQLRQHGKRLCGRHYKFEREQTWQHNLELVAALIAEGRQCERVDYLIVRKEVRGRVTQPDAVELLQRMAAMRAYGVNPDLIATACCRALRLGPRTRRYRRCGEHALRPFWIGERLKRKFPGLTDEQIGEAFRQNPDHRWARAVLGEDAADRERGSMICVNKVFPSITRKMASYYRRSDQCLFDEIVNELRSLAFS